jgi:hypothetical protein
MKTVGRWVVASIGLAGLAGLALAYSCPLVIKDAEDVIAKAEMALGKSHSGDKAAAERALAEARRTVSQARHDHETARAKADHAGAVRKAKIARAYAEEALVLADR